MKTNATWMAAVTLTAAVVLGGCGNPGVGGKAEAPRPCEPAAPTSVAVAAPAPAPIASATPTVTPAAPAAASSAKASAPVKAVTPARLTVKRLVVAEGVKNREPVEPSSLFIGEQDRIYAFIEVENPGREAGEITVAFVPPGGGAAHGNVTLPVGAQARWRTWAFTRSARTAGTWTAVVKTAHGDVIARTPFEVVL